MTSGKTNKRHAAPSGDHVERKQIGSQPESMDRTIEDAPSTAKWHKPAALAILAVVALVFLYRYVAFLSLPSAQLANIRIATVDKQSFQDAVNLRAHIVSEDSIVLSASEGGRVERKLVEEGSIVKKGQLLVEISNSTLQLSVMARQTELATQLNQLRANQIAASQRSLDFKRSLLTADKELSELELRIPRVKSLGAEGYISKEELDNMNIQRTELLERRRAIDLALTEDQKLSKNQSEEFTQTVTILRKNIEAAQQLMERLSIHAPIDGRLSALSAEVGATLKPGDELGRIDDEGRIKLQADVDQFFLPRFHPGLRGTLDYENVNYAVEVSKSYPKVQEGQFKIDLRFVGPTPPSLAVGQNLSATVELGATSVSLLLPAGPFLSQSGATAVYVVASDKHSAVRRDVTFGRRNGRFVEIQSGLMEGESVIISDYGPFDNSTKIRIVD